MPKMCKDDQQINADPQQVPALIAAGWYRCGTTPPEPPKPVTPAVEDMEKATTTSRDDPASFRMTGDWVKNTRVKVRLIKTDGETGKTRRMNGSWAQETDDVMNGAQVASAMMDTWDPSPAVIVWAIEDVLYVAAEKEGARFAIEFDQPYLDKV